MKNELVVLLGSDLSDEHRALYQDITLWAEESGKAVIFLPYVGIHYRKAYALNNVVQDKVADLAYVWQLTKALITHLSNRARDGKWIMGFLEAGVVTSISTLSVLLRLVYAEKASALPASHDYNRQQVLMNTYIRYGRMHLLDRSSRFWHRLETNLNQVEMYYGILYRLVRYVIKGEVYLVTNYSSYVHQWAAHNAWRSYGGRSYTAGCREELIKLQPREGPILQTKDHTGYRQIAERDRNHNKPAIESLEKRISSKNDPSISYMSKRSRVAGLSQEALERLAQEKGFSVLFLHDFFDSPHIYRWLSFNSFYEQAEQTIRFFRKNRRLLLVKPHPNAMDETISLYNKLRQDGDNEYIVWIDKDVPNQCIFDRLPELCITGYGSVLIEASYSGIRSLAAGDHPGTALEIGYSSKDREDYFRILRQPHEVNICTENQILDFMTQHYEYVYSEHGSWYKYYSEGSLAMRRKILSLYMEARIQEAKDQRRGASM